MSMKMIKTDLRETEKLDRESIKLMVGLCLFYAMTISLIFVATLWPWTLFFIISLIIIIWLIFMYRIEKTHEINETRMILRETRTRQDDDDENDEE